MPTPAPELRCWTAAERRLLDALLDELLPATPEESMGLPAGSAVGVADALAVRFADTPGLEPLIDEGLAKAAELLAARAVTELAALSATDRAALVSDLEQGSKSFFRAFVRHAFTAYYTHPSVPPRFGLPDRPPQPLGHAVPRDDHAELEALLAPVLARGRCYRDAG